jgi:hypothetical protein
MLSRIKLEQLYQSAHLKASHSPQIGNTLAGNCTTISYEMLQEARDLFGKDVRLVIGWFEMWGQKQFYFTERTLQDWIKGNTGAVNRVHCWLVKGNEVIDLTLTSTIRAKFPDDMPEKYTFIDSRIAKKLKIKYHEVMSGDDVLFKLNFNK